MAGTLLAHPVLTAEFKAGNTALGHRWHLLDADGTQVGRTRRVHSGGVLGRTMWKTVTVTGMDAGNDIRAEVLDGDDAVVARLFSRNVKRVPSVEVSDAGGALIATATREPGTGFTYTGPDGAVLAVIPIAQEQPAPWELRGGDGEVIGMVGRTRAQAVPMQSLVSEAIGMWDINESARDFQATMHLGFNFSREYGITMDALPAAEPLRTLAVLTPVICAYAY